MDIEDLGEDYRGWPLRQRLELIAFDTRLAGVPQEPLEALWEAIDQLFSNYPHRRNSCQRPSARV